MPRAASVFREVDPVAEWLGLVALGSAPSGSWSVRRQMAQPEQLPRPADLRLFAGTYDAGLWVAEGDDRVFIRNNRLAISLDLKAKTGEAQIVSDKEWQNVLRIVYFFELLEMGMLMLHASGVVHQGQAYIFPGPSGAGKTTIVRHSGGKPILNDEFSLLSWTHEGPEVMAYGSPFHGDWNRPGEKLAAPVKGFYFPVKDRENFVVPISPQETRNLLLARVCTFTTWKPRLEKIFDYTMELATRVPGFAFHFQPTHDFWQVLDAA